MAPEVLQVLLGRVPSMVHKAILANMIRHPVLGRVYPGVIPAPSPANINTVEGVLLCDITQREQQILDYFEDVDYVRKALSISLPPCDNNQNSQPANGDKVNAEAYIWSAGTSKLDLTRDWDYDRFREEHLEWYLDTVVKPCRIEIERQF